MSTQNPQKQIQRPLRDWEIEQARLVFGTTLKYSAVHVHEGAAWTDLANQLGIWLKRIPRPPQYIPNAITIGNHCFFPIALPDTLAGWDNWRYSFGWLIHELTHAWQFQNLGWGYLFGALAAQFSLGTRAYDFGDAAGLIAAVGAGRNLASFNPEQQGAIMQTFYDYKRLNRDVSAWLPFVNEIQAQV